MDQLCIGLRSHDGGMSHISIQMMNLPGKFATHNNYQCFVVRGNNFDNDDDDDDDDDEEEDDDDDHDEGTSRALASQAIPCTSEPKSRAHTRQLANETIICHAPSHPRTDSHQWLDSHLRCPTTW